MDQELPKINSSRQQTSEVFLPDKWKFDHDIRDVEAPNVSYRDRSLGVIQSCGVEMEDGSRYKVHEVKPSWHKQQIDLQSLKTTAFITNDDKGYNRHHQIKELESGIPSILVSRELSWETPLSQPRTSHNILKIGKYLVEQNDMVDQKNIQARGISRGAMLALGMTALSQSDRDYGLNVFYFSATAPCYPRAFKPSAKYLTMPILEAGSLAYHLAKMPLRALMHYPQTVDTNLRFATENAVALTNGDAGKFVDFMDPKTTKGYVLGYPDDVMGMGHIWEKDFKKFDNVDVELDSNILARLFNGHLRVVSHGDMSDAITRQLRLAKEIKDNGNNLDGVDFQYVNLGVA